MLRITQQHGFNVIPAAGVTPGAPVNPDHAWRFYGAPASLADAVASADFTSFGSPATEASGINNSCLEFTSTAQYLTEATAIGSGEFTVTGWAKVTANGATNAIFSPIKVTEDGSTNIMGLTLTLQSGSWLGHLQWNGTSSHITGGAANDGDWFFWAISLNSSQEVKGQINLAEYQHADPMTGNGDEIQVNTLTGGLTGGSPSMLVDEICCWPSELSVAEKTWLYNGGAGRFVNGSGQF